MENGKPSPCPREYYSEKLYYKHPDVLLTAALSRNMTNGEVAEPVSLVDQNKYKYIVSTDGEAAQLKDCGSCVRHGAKRGVEAT